MSILLTELNSSYVNHVVMVDALSSSEIAYQLKVEQKNEDQVATAGDTIRCIRNITLDKEGVYEDNEHGNIERTRRNRFKLRILIWRLSTRYS